MFVSIFIDKFKIKRIPACIAVLAISVALGLVSTLGYGIWAEVKVIGTRHGEKRYETLVTREEMAKAIDMGDYYRVPADSRDLNYDKYFVEGQEIAAALDTYHSHNTERLDVEGMKKLLLKLELVRAEFGV